jgi:hypothetical protein
MKLQSQFIKINFEYYLQEIEKQDDDIPFKDVCYYKGHLFIDDEPIPIPPQDIKKRCFVCENIIIFFHYTKSKIRKKLLGLDILLN